MANRNPHTVLSPPELEFPGCIAVPMTTEEILNYEGRLEYWDAKTATAWMVLETPAYHELPGQRLAALGTSITMVRGSHTEFFGATDLLLRDEDGKPKGILQADQTVYLHPLQAKLPEEAMVVGETDFPEVVLEVDYVTDVRRGKLSLYESWGFPEVWVEVPDQRELGQPHDPLPGMTIHVLENGAYRQVPESRVFLGWTAEEIHVAFNECQWQSKMAHFWQLKIAHLERDAAGCGVAV